MPEVGRAIPATDYSRSFIEVSADATVALTPGGDFLRVCGDTQVVFARLP